MSDEGFKVCMLGPFGAGKSSIVRGLCEEAFDDGFEFLPGKDDV